MRHLRLSWVALAASLLLPSTAAAQRAPWRVKIEKVRVGFQGAAQEEGAGTFKPGLWAPVHVTLAAAGDGDIVLPLAADDTVRGEVLVQTPDGDGVESIYRQPFGPLRKQDRFELLTYVKTASTNPPVRISIRTDGQTFGGFRASPFATQIHEHLYVTLGARLKEVTEALLEWRGDRKENKERSTAPRHVTHEGSVAKLPAVWYGYDGADLVILTTESDEFVKDLAAEKNRDRVRALAQWVRRGGRLVVSASWVHQGAVHKLLGRAYWDPPLPPLVTESWPAGHAVKTFHSAESWGRAQKYPLLQIGDELRVAQLARGPAVEVEAAERDGTPLIVRTAYGLGSVTVLAFEVQKGRFAEWGETVLEKDKKGKPLLTVSMGAATFWKTLLEKLAPRETGQRGLPPGAGIERRGDDLTTQVWAQLEVFDSPPIGFGWVALFILVYILIVGPLDYFILKKVFKRLELTWVTFPTVVLTISLIAYLTAHAIKGNELEVNKVDLLDIDQRTELGKDPKTGALRSAGARVHGTSWFTVRSPRIESYTVGLEPVFPALLAGAKEEAPACMVSWLGRPEREGMSAMGRPQSQGFFTRAYEYAPDATGIKDVGIHAWTTKAFAASWEAKLKKLPLDAALHYDARGDRQLFGTIKTNLPRDVDLRDVRLVYGNQFFALPDLPAGGPAVTVDAERLAQQNLQFWNQGGGGQPGRPDAPQFRGGRAYDPWPPVRELLFHERTDVGGMNRNHSYRTLDQSWRTEPWRDRDVAVRDAILVARLARTHGRPEELHKEEHRPPLLTHLWLKDLPGGGRQRPAISGTLYQDTYIRVILPVTPAPAKQP
jgi:hypothetical protein